jgi:hypothetical protein
LPGEREEKGPEGNAEKRDLGALFVLGSWEKVHGWPDGS